MRQTGLFLLLLAAPLNSFADNVLDQLDDDIVITASRVPISPSKMTSFAEVITDLGDHALPQLSVGQQMDGIGGVSFTNNGVRGAQSGLQLGGLSSTYNKVYLDGFNLADPSGTQEVANTSFIAPRSIQRAEILNGSQGPLYGSSAIAGVVNFFSAQIPDQGFYGESYASFGSYNTFNAGQSFGARSDMVGFAGSFDSYDSDGFSSIRENNEDDGVEINNASIKFSLTPTSRIKLGANAIYREADVDYDGTFPSVNSSGLQTSEIKGVRTSTELVLVEEQDYALTFIGEAQSLHFERKEDFGDYDGDRKQAGGHLRFDYEQGFSLLGFDYERVSSTESSTKNSYDIRGFFAEQFLELSTGTSISGGIRRDDHATYGTHGTYQLGMAQEIFENFVVKANYATGFRAPSNYELYGSFGAGNKNLKPETSRGYDLGVAGKLASHFSYSLRGYQTTITDRIGYNNNSFKYQQIEGDSKVWGAELALKASMGPYNIAQTYNYAYGTEPTSATDSSSRVIAGVPRHSGKTTATYQGQNFLLQATGLFHAETVQYANTTKPQLDDFVTMNLNGSYQLTEHATIEASVINLFDSDYVTAHGNGFEYQQPGLSGNIGLRIKF